MVAKRRKTAQAESTSPPPRVPVIHRYLTEDQWARRRDFQFLAAMARRSRGQLDFLIRKDRVTLYHQGNHVCTVHVRLPRYRVEFTTVFFEQAFPAGERTSEDRFLRLPLRRTTKATNLDGLTAKQLKRVLSEKVIKRLMAAIRWRDYGQEIAFEQLLMAQNPPTPELIVIDRQVSDTAMGRKRMDVLALRQIEEGENRYRFCVVEIKLGSNAELDGRVVGQLERYLGHLVGDVLEDYRVSYERMYGQLVGIGMLPGENLFDGIQIDTERVDGMIVVGYLDPVSEGQVRSIKRRGLEVRTVDLRL